MLLILAKFFCLADASCTSKSTDFFKFSKLL